MAAVAAETDGELLFGQVVGVQPGLTTTAPEVVQGVITEQPGAFEGRDGGRGSLEFLGRWKEKRDDRAMPFKITCDEDRDTHHVRVALGKLVDELVQTNASSGILAISTWEENRGKAGSATVRGFFWSASPDDKSYQRHGLVGKASRKNENFHFADFEGVVDDLGDKDQMAVYCITLPSRGLDPDKWSGRPPPLARADLYTGPRSDGLLSTYEVSGDYYCCLFPLIFNSMTVVPHGPDAIETWRTGCVLPLGPMAQVPPGGVQTRDPGTNEFGGMTFSADGTAKQHPCHCSACGPGILAYLWSGSYKKRPDSKRAFQKVETRDLAGKWRGCGWIPYPLAQPFSFICCTRKKALNEDQYEESGRCFVLALPLPWPVGPTTRTRKYVNGHPTNAFAKDGSSHPMDVLWYRDPGCAAQFPFIFAKKAG